MIGNDAVGTAAGETAATLAAAELALGGSGRPEGAGPEAGAPEAGARCRNCGTPVAGRFCTTCGQSLRDDSRSLWSLVREALEGLYNFDGRVLLTLRHLFLRPGLMTADWNAGKRARYVPPLRLYLFTSLLFFLTLSQANVALLVVEMAPAEGAGNPAATAPAAPEGEAAGSADAGPGADAGSGADVAAGSVVVTTDRAARFRFLVDLDTWKPPAQIDMAQVQQSLDENLRIKTGDPESEAAVLDWVRRLFHGMAVSVDQPQSLNRIMGDKLAKLMFVLMPVFAVLLALLYRRQHRYMVEHLVFALHLHTLVFATVMLAVWLQQVPGTVLAPAVGWAMQGFPVLVGAYLWLALRRVYGQGVVKTTVKGALLGATYFVIVSTVLVATLVLSLPEV
ncbi:DUF3667 domain-containing protein [Rhodospirillum centenum]|uniref:DUF3667 domain-containing protein n=1 Tax=Rhodospirillum centenum (strain ATCC 51521 / SW) TaxID=414684 RepID=B6IP36_RHOCS|nr:DUF3667 domain-containing protein [Rhodospirillum centenum]ACI99456.1 conserved hypothetical protein [Rhodospirillum centenum SW]